MDIDKATKLMMVLYIELLNKAIVCVFPKGCNSLKAVWENTLCLIAYVIHSNHDINTLEHLMTTAMENKTYFFMCNSQKNCVRNEYKTFIYNHIEEFIYIKYLFCLLVLFCFISYFGCFFSEQPWTEWDIYWSPWIQRWLSCTWHTQMRFFIFVPTGIQGNL